MKIQSISIVPEKVGCNASCKYCIASMTQTPKSGDKINYDKLSNALQYAIAGGAQTAIITSKGETLLSDWDYIGDILKYTKEHGFGQRDLHSNMMNVLERKEEFLEELVKPAYGLTNVTMTLPSMDYETSQKLMGATTDYDSLFKFLREEADLVVRLSCVMNKQGVHDRETIEDYITKAKEKGVNQIVFRGLWIPDNSKHTKVYEWSRENRVDASIARTALEEMVQEGKAHKMFELPWGESVYDVDGVNVSTSGRCSETKSGVMKSLIYLPDNHVYSDWQYKGSIIF